MNRICRHTACRKPALTRRTECSQHRAERIKGKDPEKYAYDTLRHNAKRRGKDFTLTLDEFRQFCAQTQYMAGAGRGSTSLHIDRIDESKGYSLDNIQVLTNAENVKKYLRYSYNGASMDFHVETVRENNEIDDDLPF